MVNILFSKCSRKLLNLLFTQGNVTKIRCQLSVTEHHTPWHFSSLLGQIPIEIRWQIKDVIYCMMFYLLRIYEYFAVIALCAFVIGLSIK